MGNISTFYVKQYGMEIALKTLLFSITYVSKSITTNMSFTFSYTDADGKNK
jgi:hypothetical protein